MLGLILGGVICLSSGCIGLYIKRNYREKMRFYEVFYSFIDNVIAEIESNKTPFMQIMEKRVESEQDVFSALLERFMRGEEHAVKQTRGLERWCAEKLKLGLDSDEKYALSVLSDIGRYDSKTEVARLRKVHDDIGRRLNKATEQYNKDGSMIFNLSILLGIVIMILLA